MITEEKSDLQKYYLLKKDIDLPVKVKLYFFIFENAINQTKAPRTIDSKKGFSKALLNAFSNLSPNEKGMYLLSNINFVLQQLDRQQKQKTKSDSIVQSDEIRNIETTCQMLMSTLKISHWTTVSLRLDKIKKSVLITNKKKNFIIDMSNYFVRRSNKYKASIVLEAITEEINNEAKKYIFSFSNQVVSSVYQEMLKCTFICQHEKILSMMAEQHEQDKDSQKSHPIEKALVFLNSNNINNYLSYKQKVQKQIMQNKFQFKTLLTQDRLKIEQSTKVEKVWRLQNIFDVDPKQLKQKFMYSLAYKNKYIVYSQVLQQFSKKYKALYQKITINGKTYEFICIREESISNQEQVLFVKGIQNIMVRNYIQFLQVRVRTMNPCQSKLIVYISVGINGVNSMLGKQVVKNFLMELNDMIFRKEQKIILTTSMNQNEESCTSNMEMDKADDDFTTVKGSEENVVDFQQDDGQLEYEASSPTARERKMQELQQSEQKIDKSTESGYLFVKHDQQPIDSEKFHKIMAKHYLFQEWIRAKNGGVICTNQQIIGLQKRMFKEGIMKMGTHILKGQILKMSLPVIIFRKQSHLESIARDFCYAPMFFDKLAKDGDTLQRVKYATLLAISVGTLGISMQKPFNPILGQTLQLRIDGCPIYLEQISHHPPIGAYYFQGRDYRIHGQIQPKIAFGLNNVKGYSNRPNFLQFQDGTQIEMIYGKMVINGMMIGDRSFNFEDKIYAYDKKNHIFSQIIYGPRKKSVTKKNDPQDFIHGSIYKLKPQFLQKFNKSMPRIFPTKQFIVSQLSTFEGMWTDQIKFDNKVYVNFCKQLPYDLIHEEHPLLSNSTFRGDLIKLIENNIPDAQKQKERLQQIQRRDRKLREKYYPHH